MQTQVVQIPLSRWNRIERILDRLDRETKQKERIEWISAKVFMSRSGKSKEQLRGLRKKHTEGFTKEVVTGYKGIDEDGKRSVRYLYNWTFYQSHYHA